MEEPAEILVRFSTDEPDAAAEPVAGSLAREEAATDRPPAGEAAAEPVAAPPAREEAAAEPVAAPPAREEAAAEPVAAPPAREEAAAEPVAAPLAEFSIAAQPIEAIVAASSEGPPAYEPDEPGPVEDVSLLLRLARIHLRTGSLTTARAQLESLAGRNQLDTAGTLDLAEARWRTGDLQGAGDAAGVYLAANGGEALGLVIAAEAASLGIREAEARGYMEQARLRTLTSFDAIFAGIPRRSKLTESERETTAGPEQIPVAGSAKAVEPAAEPVAKSAAETVAELQPKVEAEPVATATVVAEAEPVATAAQPVAMVAPEPEPAAEAGLIGADAEAEPEPTPTVPVAGVAGTPATGPSIADQATQPAADSSRTQADTEIAAGIALLETGDALLAALHLGIALRMTPESAQAVLGAIGDRHDLALELVRGDALRMQGLEHDAGQAYQSVASALSGARAAAEPPAKTPAGPAEAVAEVPAEPPGPLPVDAAAEVPAERAATKSTEAPQEAKSPELRPPEPAPPIVWSD
jgi:hypothetical protein